MQKLTWKQVNAWRLSQHALAARVPRHAMPEIVSRVGGIQAQVMSAAEIAIWARVHDITRADIQKALWQDRTLVKMWAMRSTLHLLRAADLPMFAAALRWHRFRNYRAYFEFYGFTPKQQQAFYDAFAHVLGGEPLTREQLAAAIAKHTRIPKLRAFIASTHWGTPFLPAVFNGELCFGPSQGVNTTFVNPRHWLDAADTPEPLQAAQQLLRLYLRAYGPSTPADFARWMWGGAGIIQAKQLFQHLDAELQPVNIEGWHGFALQETIEPMLKSKIPHTVRLLPMFDDYTFALTRAAEHLLPKKYSAQVFRPQGWISAVVLVNGIIHGVWDAKTKSQTTTLKIRPFLPLTPSTRKGIQAEAKALGDFLNTQVLIEYD